MKTKFYYYIILVILFWGCTHTVSIKNEREGKLTANYQLVVGSEKKILLDYDTAPKPPYMQMIKGELGEQILTFLNPYKYAIYFYNYENGELIRKIEYEKEGPNGILRLEGYYIKNMDSIYVFSGMVELALTDSTGHVKQRISLRDNRTDREWARYYPQYFLSTVNPLIETQGKLILTGTEPSGIRDSLIRKFHFTSCVDLKTGNVQFVHSYPEELYGSDVNWQDFYYTQGYREISPSGEWLYSFPVSHDVYITQLDAEGYKTVYAGSNVARTIRPINADRRNTPYEIIHTHFLNHDLYFALLHDPYRNVYYRFMLQGMPDATIQTRIEEKSIVVILMDEQFNYMGETVIGPWEKWNWGNSFVTSEGLMIEYHDPDLDSEEEYLHFKTFTIEKL